MEEARSRRGVRGREIPVNAGIAVRGVFAGFVLTLGGGSGLAQAQGPPQPLTGELAVNQAIAGAQNSASVGMRDNGTYVVVWRGNATGGTTDIFMRRFPGDGTSPFNESTLNQVTAGSQLAPTIDVNATGDWVAVWAADQSGQGLRARASSGGGTVLGNEFQFSDATAGTTFSRPRVSRIEDGSWGGAWVNFGAKFRRFDDTGAAVTGELAPGATLVSPDQPAVLAIAEGELWVLLEAQDADERGIYLERYDSFGTQIGASDLVAQSEANLQLAPDVDGAADGGFVAVWVDDTLGIRARCFAADGTPRSGELAVDPRADTPRIAVASDGAFVVTWKSVDNDIEAREFDRTGRPVGAAFTVNTATAGFQTSPDVGTSNDRFVVVWHGEDTVGDGDSHGVARRLFRRRSIFADHFESAGNSAWSAVVP